MSDDANESVRQVPVNEVLPREAAPPMAPPHDSHRPPSVTVIPLPPARRSTRLRWLLVGIVSVLLIGGGAWYWINGGPPPVQYKTAAVDRGPITSIVTATGTVVLRAAAIQGTTASATAQITAASAWSNATVSPRMSADVNTAGFDP